MLLLLQLCEFVLAHNPLSTMPRTAEAWCDPGKARDVVLARQQFRHESLEYEVEVMQHVPLVAAVRGFAGAAECAEINRMTAHWLEEPRSRRDTICGKKDCGCWFDVLLDNHTASPLQALNHRTAALLRSLSRADVDYSRARPVGMARQQLYNSFAHDEGAWCAPHCDSACNGELLEKVKGIRAVAMVSCKVAEDGGETSLSRSNVIYRPHNVGDLVLFGLKQSNERMDADGLTEHAGCPVWRGEKWILTLRLGEEEPHADLGQITPAESIHDYYDAPVPGEPVVFLKGSDVLARRDHTRIQHAQQQQDDREL